MRYVKLEEICFKGVSSLRQKDTLPVGDYPVYGASGICGYLSGYQHNEPYVAVVKDGAGVGRVQLCSGKSSVLGTLQALLPKDEVSCEYLYEVVRSLELGAGFTGSTIPHIYFKDYKNRTVVIYEKEQQTKITTLFTTLKNVVELHKCAISFYDELVKSRFVEMFGRIDKIDSSFVLWADVVEIINGKDYKTNQVKSGGYPVYGTGGEIARADSFLCPANSVIVGRKGTINNPLLITEPFWNVDTAFGIVPKENKMHYLYLYWFCKQFDFSQLNKSTTLPSTTKKDLLKIEIKLPEYALQQEFADFVHQVDKLKFDFDFLVSFSIPSICLFCLKLDP